MQRQVLPPVPMFLTLRSARRPSASAARLRSPTTFTTPAIPCRELFLPTRLELTLALPVPLLPSRLAVVLRRVVPLSQPGNLHVHSQSFPLRLQRSRPPSVRLP